MFISVLGKSSRRQATSLIQTIAAINYKIIAKLIYDNIRSEMTSVCPVSLRLGILSSYFLLLQ